MKAIQITGEIKVFAQLPKTWKNHMNFRMASVEMQQQEGFYDVIQPEYNTELQRLGEIYFDETNQYFTYPVNDIPQAELDERKQRELDMLDNQFDRDAAKRLLRKVAEPILADEANLTEQDIEDAKMLYKQYRVGVIYDKDSDDIDKKRFVWNGDLYKVIGTRHTSQADWTPDTAVSLYVKITPPGTIAVWEQPTAENAYMTGDKVYYPTENDSIYESLIDDNVWSPDEYPDGWEVQV